MTDIDVGQLSEAINDKMDRDMNNRTATIHYVIETYVDGTSGYRIWDDGYCEQWGKSSAPETVSLVKTYSSTDYNITFGVWGTLIEKNSPVILSWTTSSFTYSADSRMFIMWKTSGYLAEGEY